MNIDKLALLKTFAYKNGETSFGACFCFVFNLKKVALGR